MDLSQISGASTMAQILETYPGAQSALFRKYHVGGCNSCGFQPTDTLEQVCRSHNIPGVDEAISYLRESQKLDAKIQISPEHLKKAIEANGDLRLLDVRSPEEYESAKIQGSTLVTDEVTTEIFEKWPKDTPIVLLCHVGERSLQAAAHLLERGFTNVKSLTGGIDAWSQHIDDSIARY